MPKLSLAVWRYDRTQAFYDGRIGVEGYDLELIDLPLEEMFSRAFEGAEFDVTELSFSNYLRLSAVGKCAYVGLPVFPSRSFRHGAFYVRDDGAITSPADLVGKRVGVREYSMTAALAARGALRDHYGGEGASIHWIPAALAARGALRDHYGVEGASIHWVMGDVDHKERETIVLPTLHKPISIEAAPEGALLGDMLVDGRLDAVLAYKPLEAFRAGRGVRRLIADHAAAEAEYFQKTGIFPVMHLMAVRKDVVAAAPDLAGKLVAAFARAQQLATDDLFTEQALKIGLPWIAEEVKRTIAIMGADFWPNGLAANRKVLERMIGWSHADGMIAERPDVDSLFLDPGL